LPGSRFPVPAVVVCPIPLSLRLSALFAHPDDETFSGGGTYAKYSAAGVRCTLWCATDGDAGKSSGLSVGSRAELGRVRRAELAAAAKVLGFASVDTPGHPDGGLGAMDQQVLIGGMVAHLRRERPDVVITFGPEGAPNTHPDHRVVSRAATAAFFLAANPSVFPDSQNAEPTTCNPKRLFYVAWPPPMPDAVLRTHSVPATARIDVRAHRATELAAWREHRSQHALQQRFDETAATDEEWYALAAGVSQPAPMITDFFAGIHGG